MLSKLCFKKCHIIFKLESFTVNSGCYVNDWCKLLTITKVAKTEWSGRQVINQNEKHNNESCPQTDVWKNQ
jgi:hypothetical protein